MNSPKFHRSGRAEHPLQAAHKASGHSAVSAHRAAHAEFQAIRRSDAAPKTKKKTMGPPRPAPPTIHASLPPLPKDQPPQQIKSDTADLTVLQDDGVEVFDSVDIDDMGRGLYPALPFAETSADDTAVTIYRPRKDAQVPTNWTVDALEELVTRTPFLSSEGTVVFTGKLLSDVVSDETNCPQGIICAAQDDNSKALIERRTWTLEALDRASGELLCGPQLPD